MKNEKEVSAEADVFSEEHLATAKSNVRDALKLPAVDGDVPEMTLNKSELIASLSTEIHDLRLAGHSDDEIAELLSVRGASISTEEIAKYYQDPF